MKRKTLILLAAFVGSLVLSSRPARAEVNVSISFFYDELSPYGRWASVGSYGDCWIPSNVAAGWQPYTDGEWVYTEYGWTWVSYDPWGGDPYHYGTWVWEDPWGWVWAPGTIWAPAWVTWCYSDSYVGWAPIPPSLSISFSGYAGPAVVVSQSRYVFVPVNRFSGVRVSTVRLPVRENAAIFPRVRKVTSFSVSHGIMVNRGPSVDRIERAARTRIPRRSISELKSRPVPLSSSGVTRGRRAAVVSPAPVRAREIAARRGGARPESRGGPQREAAPRRGTHPAPKGSRAPAPSSPPRRGKKGRQAPPPARHEAPPPARHEAPPPARHEAAPQARHEAAPPARHEAPPPARHEAPPPARHEAAPPARHSPPPPPPHGHPAGERRAAPPKHEPPPPPPPAGREHGPKKKDTGPNRRA